MNWYWIALILLVAITALMVLSSLFYRRFFKRFYDIVISGLGMVLLSPIFLILIFLGAIVMHDNPFFIQQRPGKIDPKNGQERVFSLIKFRTMTNAKDSNGNLLPDESRINSYGSFLRSSSLDELPEMINIFIGDMSIIGPRPLLVKYLPLYTKEQHHRHDVKPGLTGYAQAHGRNNVTWEDRFAMDVWYTNNVSFAVDIRIVFATIKTVVRHDGISSKTSATMEEFKGTPIGVSKRTRG